MTDQDPTEGEFHIVEHPIAGPARQFQVTLGDGTTLGVHSDPIDRIVQLDVVPPDRDAATATVELSETEAAAFASLLAGMRFLTSSYRGPHAGGAVQVRTATVPAGSPMVGRLVGEMAAIVPAEERNDLAVLAVVRDGTPDLVESPERPCEPGDRLVVVSRPGAFESFERHLLG
jgi:K+/H+ antiporter YhaU regulatory subunit KhtT